MDFDWSAELRALRAEAEEVAGKGAAGRDGQHEDCLDHRVLARLLARARRAGLARHDVAGRARRPRAHAARAVRRLRGDDRRRRARSPRRGSPTARWARRCSRSAPTSSGAASSPASSPARPDWCIGMSEPDAGSDLASLRTRAVRDGDDVRRQRPKIWTSLRRRRRLVLPDLPHRSDATGRARGPLRADRRHRHARASPSRPIDDMTGNRHFCEVVFDDVRVPGANLVGERGRLVRADHAPARARAGRHRPAAHQPGALPRRARRAPTVATRCVRQEIAALESATGSAACSCCARCWARRPRRSRPPPRRSAPSFEQRVGRLRAPGPGARGHCSGAARPAGVCYAPAYTIMGGTSNVLRNIIGERVLGLPEGARPLTLTIGASDRVEGPLRYLKLRSRGRGLAGDCAAGCAQREPHRHPPEPREPVLAPGSRPWAERLRGGVCHVRPRRRP